jgi:2-polyprenyl-3-methyl-5-hydroxy-6-metoxy-1,4-benzoquinol methylase
MRFQPMEWTPERVGLFWEYASQFPETFFSYRHGRKLVRRFHPHLRNAQTVLDYACGVGHLTGHLLEAGYNVGAVETSHEGRSAVKKTFGGHAAFQGVWSPQEALEAGSRFDAIFVCELIEHLSDDALDDTLKTLHALSSSKARIIFTTPHNENLESNTVLCPCCRHFFHRRQHLRKWQIDSLRDKLQQSGFRIVEIYSTSFNKRGTWVGTARRFLRQPWNLGRDMRDGPNLVAIAAPG